LERGQNDAGRGGQIEGVEVNAGRATVAADPTLGMFSGVVVLCRIPRDAPRLRPSPTPTPSSSSGSTPRTRFRAVGLPWGDDGSWIIGGFEHFDDGREHVSIWSVDAAGNGVRLGCDPTADTYYSGVLSAVLPTATAVFAIAAAGNSASGSYDFTLVRLAR